jgi:hypothetical protein
MTKTAAIAHARRTVSALYPFGGGYRYTIADPNSGNRHETHPRPYYAAAAARRADLISIARAAADLPEIDPWAMDAGPWTDAVTAIA